MTPIYLASRSPRRRQLLGQLGVAFRVVDVAVDESRDAAEPARLLVPRLALAKARAGRAGLPATAVVIGADTEVVLDGRVLGKPADEQDAVNMLLALSGRTHLVYSAVAVSALDDVVALSVSRVTFRRLDKRRCRDYCATGEPFDKAGGYAIQGLGAAFVRRLEGSYSGVVGLPLAETAMLLQRFGRHGDNRPAADT